MDPVAAQVLETWEQAYRPIGGGAVMIGRPFCTAALGGLKEGVGKYLDQVRGELTQAMILTGCARVADAGRDILFGA